MKPMRSMHIYDKPFTRRTDNNTKMLTMCVTQSLLHRQTASITASTYSSRSNATISSYSTGSRALSSARTITSGSIATTGAFSSDFRCLSPPSTPTDQMPTSLFTHASSIRQSCRCGTWSRASRRSRWSSSACSGSYRSARGTHRMRRKPSGRLRCCLRVRARMALRLPQVQWCGTAAIVVSATVAAAAISAAARASTGDDGQNLFSQVVLQLPLTRG